MALPGTRGDAAPPAIELRGISKAFGPVQANRDISLVVPPGTIHGIVGENGAGKSTLMSILYGFYRPDAGQILVGGRDAGITDSQSAIRARARESGKPSGTTRDTVGVPDQAATREADSSRARAIASACPSKS